MNVNHGGHHIAANYGEDNPKPSACTADHEGESGCTKGHPMPKMNACTRDHPKLMFASTMDHPQTRQNACKMDHPKPRQNACTMDHP